MATAPIVVTRIWAGLARPLLICSSGSACSRASSVFGSSWLMGSSAHWCRTTSEETDRFRAEREAAPRRLEVYVGSLFLRKAGIHLSGKALGTGRRLPGVG